MTYQDCLDKIFESFIRAKPHLQNKYDRETRDPHRLLSLAHKLDLLPNPNNVIKVTGSKGKGTTARFIADMICANQAEQKVGLVISPEEIDHLDRMRINGISIDQKNFCDIANNILDALKPLEPPAYYSPYGVFLLIALAWFKREKVNHIVIECGRGVLFDEGGQLQASIGVVTSILLEHADKLGPTLEEIRMDKLSIQATSDSLILGKQVLGKREMFSALDYPNWMQSCAQLGEEATRKYLGQEELTPPKMISSSFGEIDLKNGGKIIFEAMVNDESLDRIYWRKKIETYGNRISVIISVTDDKNFQKISEFYAAVDIAVQHVILTGNRGELCYDATSKSEVVYTGDYSDVSSFKNILMPKPDKISAFIGTQNFIRLVKRAFQ